MVLFRRVRQSFWGILPYMCNQTQGISSYGIALVAEKMGWQTTLFTWAGIALLGIVLCLAAYRKWSNFIR